MLNKKGATANPAAMWMGPTWEVPPKEHAKMIQNSGLRNVSLFCSLASWHMGYFLNHARGVSSSHWSYWCNIYSPHCCFSGESIWLCQRYLLNLLVSHNFPDGRHLLSFPPNSEPPKRFSKVFLCFLRWTCQKLWQPNPVDSSHPMFWKAV